MEPFPWGPAFEPLLADRRSFDQARVDSCQNGQLAVIWPKGPESRQKLRSGSRPPKLGAAMRRGRPVWAVAPSAAWVVLGRYPTF